MAIGELREAYAALVPRTIASEQGRAVVLLWANWCSGSRSFKLIFDRVASEWNHGVQFQKMDVEECSFVVPQFGKQVVIPALFFFHDGVAVKEFQGTRSEEEFRALLQRYCNGNGGATEAHS